VALLRHNELTMALPPGWKDETEVVAIVALERPEHRFRATVVVSCDRAAEGETADAFAARQLPLLRGAFLEYTVIAEGPLRIGAQDGFVREHSFASRAGNVPATVETVQQLQWYVIHDGTAYTFRFSDLPADFADSRPTAITLFERVSFTEGDPLR
jgi:hypothetical protein